jgi:FMN phosphatase YigB (HAD superfamily)
MSNPSHTGVSWDATQGVIFDVDGTLFDHIALRRPMVLKLLSHLATGRLSYRDLVALQAFRKERDHLASIGADNIGRRQFEQVAARLGRSYGDVEAIATRWLCDEPLPLVARYAFPGAARFVAALRERGVRTGAFSDYPTAGKLGVLGIELEVACDAGQPEIGRLKPHPEGFLHVARRLQIDPARCLIIGDRDDRDGEAARRGGFSFLRRTSAASPARPGEFADYADLIRELETIAPKAVGGPPTETGVAWRA